MTPDKIIRLLAEPSRTRVLAAIALGATQPTAIAESTNLSPKDIAIALLRLQDGGLVTTEATGLAVNYRQLRLLSREPTTVDDETEPAGADALRPFVRGDRLLRFPSRQARRQVVLEHIAASSFAVGTTYDEKAVNDKLRAWCDGSDVDHVSVRRYLVDSGILTRANGIYSRSPESLPTRGVAERCVTAMGLD